MSIPTEPATLPGKPAGADDVVGTAKASAGGDSTFTGTQKNGVVPGVLVEMKHKTSANPFNNGEPRDQIVWLFAIKGREAEGLLAWYTSYSLHEKSKFPPTCEALGKPVPDDGEGIKKSAFIGAECQLLIKNEAAKGKTKTFPKVKELLSA